MTTTHIGEGAIDVLTIARIAAITHGSLYLAGVFVAGVITESPPAWRLALASMGVAYLGEIALQFNLAYPNKHTHDAAEFGAAVCFIVSVIAGVAAGMCLL